MSKDYMVLIVQPDNGDIDGASAKLFMRFTEPPDDDFLKRLAATVPGKRVYTLSGASTWYEVGQGFAEPPPPVFQHHPVRSAVAAMIAGAVITAAILVLA